MNHFKTFLHLFILFGFLFSSDIQAKSNHSKKAKEIASLKKNIEAHPKNVKPRLALANHYRQKKNWPMVVKYLEPVIEQLPKKALYQLISAFVHLSQFQEAISLINGLLNQKKVSTSTYLVAIRTHSGRIDAANEEKIKDIWSESTDHCSCAASNTKNKKAKSRLPPCKEGFCKDLCIRNPSCREIFRLLRVVQTKEPENVKIYDLWLEMLEKYIPHYANESLRVMEVMEENKVKMKRRHYSKLCKYNNLAGFIAETKKTCLEAVGKDPDNPDNYIHLGEAYRDTGEKEIGKRILARVGKKFSHSEQALWTTANAYYENKETIPAYEYYLKATKHEDAKPRDFLGLAKTAFELKKYEISLKAFSEHCRRSRILDQEFRRASGLLKEQPLWQERFRKKMQHCKPTKNNQKSHFDT